MKPDLKFGTLQDIKDYCDKNYKSPLQIIEESDFARTLVPPKKSYHFIILVIPPINGKDLAESMKPLVEKIKESGFDAKLTQGKTTGGYHIELIVSELIESSNGQS